MSCYYNRHSIVSQVCCSQCDYGGLSEETIYFGESPQYGGTMENVSRASMDSMIWWANPLKGFAQKGKKKSDFIQENPLKSAW